MACTNCYHCRELDELKAALRNVAAPPSPAAREATNVKATWIHHAPTCGVFATGHRCTCEPTKEEWPQGQPPNVVISSNRNNEERTCNTCRRPYDKFARPQLCSSSFHCCRDCEWDMGRLVKPCADHAGDGSGK